jgi:hypothetical protein
MSQEEDFKLHNCLQMTRDLYEKQESLYCPYFGTRIILNSDGFNHLQNKPNRQPRSVGEQIYKLALLKKALKIIPKCGTVQEYRDRVEKIGKKGKDGFYKTKRVQYWGFLAILENNTSKIKIILKKIGDGNVVFWSVMPVQTKMYQEGIEED